MRLSLPERFTVRQTLSFALGLMTVQLLEGTDLAFGLLTFAYVVILALSYNAAGGFFYPSGAWILFTGVETALIGLTYKATLFQPAHRNLREPTTTMLVYCAGLGGMGLAGWLSSLLRPRRGLLAGFSVGAQMKESAIGCLIVGIPMMYVSQVGLHESASFASGLAQLNHFLPLAILLGTVYEIESSGGRSCTNWVVWAAGLAMFGQGLLSYSKEGMFTPVVTWLITTVVLRFRFSKLQVLLGVGFAVFSFYYLVPFTQAGRASRDPDSQIINNYDDVVRYLSDLNGTRQLYLESNLVTKIDEVPHLYDESGGFFDRLQMLAFDDALITLTDEGSVFGLAPTVGTFVNAVPRFLWKDKPEYLSGNVFGREIGVISENDESTGISFSPTADAYHEAKWLGVLLVEPVVMFIMFFVIDSLSGDVRVSPWGLLFIAMSAHAAPEGEMPGTIWIATYGAEGVIFAAIISGYLMPFLSRLLLMGRRAGGQVESAVIFPARPAGSRLREAAAQAEGGGAGL
jgi:hypothetical protein